MSSQFWRFMSVSKVKFSPQNMPENNKQALFPPTHYELFQTGDVNTPLLESNFCRTESNYLLEDGFWLALYLIHSGSTCFSALCGRLTLPKTDALCSINWIRWCIIELLTISSICCTRTSSCLVAIFALRKRRFSFWGKKIETWS